VYPDGPLILRGGVVVQDISGNVLSAGRVVALCRCGRSALKPFCDGSHKRASVVRSDHDAPRQEPDGRSDGHPAVDVLPPQRALPLSPATEHVIGESRIDV
jgi:CDGSH-type Zn-finger protein